MRKIDLPENELKKLYAEDKLTICQIAKLFRCSSSLVSTRLKEYNIPTWWKPVNISKETLARLYNMDGLSVAEIATHFNCGQTTIISKMNTYEIVSRKKIVLLSKDALEELYHKQKLEQRQIANLLGCDQATISNKMRKAGIKARNKSEISTKYPKYNFSNDLLEKAYIIGFRLGDLHVRRHRNLISVEGTTTRPEQIELIKGLFNKYAQITTNINKRGATKISCLLNSSFLFLLEKEDKIPGWLLGDSNLFLSFLAGYTDAEGCIGIYPGKGNHTSIMFILRTYDKNILLQAWNKLITLNVVCQKPKICTVKGSQNNKQDFWRLGVFKKESLRILFGLLQPYVRHPRITAGIKKAFQILGQKEAKCA